MINGDHEHFAKLKSYMLSKGRLHPAVTFPRKICEIKPPTIMCTSCNRKYSDYGPLFFSKSADNFETVHKTC